jgi:2,4-dienoyl-CoA reductase-like NADH-dependent reductase (Old Yellow Enzyme family)
VKYTSPGRLRTVAEFRDTWQGLDEAMLCDETLHGADGALGRPLEVHGRVLANRFAVHPMEGWDATTDGLPTERTLRRWRRFGASGADLVWGGEAFAVRPSGRANPNQLCLHPDADTGAGLRALHGVLGQGRAEIGGGDAWLVGLQLTHSGRFARPDDGGPRPVIAHRHPDLDERAGLGDDHPLVTDAELEAIGDDFVRTAALAQKSGFDFVDVKCCHGYLLHELLAAHTRPGAYGGSFENRTRLLQRIIGGIRAACPGLEIGVRVSIIDTCPFARDGATGIGTPVAAGRRPYLWGFGVDHDDPLNHDLAEPHRLLALLHGLGVRLVNVTIGSPYYCPHVQRPAAYPPSDGYDPPRNPLLEVARHLHAVRDCKRAFPDLLLVGSGYTYLQDYLPHVAQAEVGAGHVDFVGLGRMVLSYPDLPRDVLAGTTADRRRICRTFSDCTTAPRNGLPSGCYPLDDAYRSSPEAVHLKVVKKGASG